MTQQDSTTKPAEATSSGDPTTGSTGTIPARPNKPDVAALVPTPVWPGKKSESLLGYLKTVRETAEWIIANYEEFINFVEAKAAIAKAQANAAQHRIEVLANENQRLTEQLAAMAELDDTFLAFLARISGVLSRLMKEDLVPVIKRNQQLQGPWVKPMYIPSATLTTGDKLVRFELTSENSIIKVFYGNGITPLLLHANPSGTLVDHEDYTLKGWLNLWRNPAEREDLSPASQRRFFERPTPKRLPTSREEVNVLLGRAALKHTITDGAYLLEQESPPGTRFMESRHDCGPNCPQHNGIW